MPSAARRPASTTRGSIDPVPEVKGRRVASRRIPAPNREKTELSPPTPAVITVRVPLAIYRRRARKLVFTPDGEPRRPQPARIDNSMVKALARAFRWRKLLETGVHGTIDELAKAETINPSYVSRILRLTLLAPEFVEAILDEQQPAGLLLQSLLRGISISWVDQNTMDHSPTGLPNVRT